VQECEASESSSIVFDRVGSGGVKYLAYEDWELCTFFAKKKSKAKYSPEEQTEGGFRVGRSLSYLGGKKNLMGSLDVGLITRKEEKGHSERGMKVLDPRGISAMQEGLGGEPLTRPNDLFDILSHPGKREETS